MDQYILLLRKENIDFSQYSPEDFQKLMADFDSWNAKLEAKGLLGSVGIASKSAKTVRQKDDAIAVDGPYCETKEAIAGFCLINADDEEEAQRLAADCPFLPRGGSVEIRGIDQLELNQTIKADESA